MIQEGKKKKEFYLCFHFSLFIQATHSFQFFMCNTKAVEPATLLSVFTYVIYGQSWNVHQLCLYIKKKWTSQYYYLIFLIVFPWLCRRSNYTSSWLLNNVTISAFPNLQRWTTACDSYLTAVHSYSTVSARSYKWVLWQKLKVKIKSVLFFPWFFPPRNDF